MRGDLELHPRHFIYSLSGFFSGFTIHDFINKVLLSGAVTSSKTNNISEVLLYVFMVLGVMAGLYIDDYVIKHKYEINYKKFLMAEIITVVIFDLFFAILFVFTYKF